MSLQYPSLGTGPSSISEVDPSVSSLLASLKPLNHPLVSNETTDSSVGPNGLKPCSFVGSSLVGTSTAANDILLGQPAS